MEKDCAEIENFIKTLPNVLAVAAEPNITVDGKNGCIAFVTPKADTKERRSSLEKGKVKIWAKVYDAATQRRTKPRILNSIPVLIDEHVY